MYSAFIFTLFQAQLCKRIRRNNIVQNTPVEQINEINKIDYDYETKIIEAEYRKRGIDDKDYAFDKAQAWHSYGQPKMQIYSKLKKAGVQDDMIDAALACLDEETERNNATKLARRLTHSIKEQSSRMQRQTLVNKLVTKGYSFEIAKQVSESIELDENEVDIRWKVNTLIRGCLTDDGE